MKKIFVLHIIGALASIVWTVAQIKTGHAFLAVMGVLCAGFEARAAFKPKKLEDFWIGIFGICLVLNGISAAISNGVTRLESVCMVILMAETLVAGHLFNRIQNEQPEV